jgi:murein DD-endopeptidase MepM/ murein hydrolase activator NlpD
VTKRRRHRAPRPSRPSRPSRPRRPIRLIHAIRPGVAVAVLVGVAVALIPMGPPAAASSATHSLAPPLPPPLVVLRAFTPPASPWDAGNRGVDLAATGGEPVFAGVSGRVIYAGALAGRGVISIDDGSVHLTYEPVEPAVAVGSTVVAGELIGQVADELDACGPPGSCLHWGVRSGSSYLDPLALLRAPKVRLLPIWSGGLPAIAAVVAHAAVAVAAGVRRAGESPTLAPLCR